MKEENNLARENQSPFYILRLNWKRGISVNKTGLP